MNTYEFTFLVEDAKEAKKVETALEAQEGKKLNEIAWGKRLLTFPINKVTAAEYFTWDIQMSPKNLADFKKKLNYDKLVLRYLLLNQDHTPESSPAKREEKSE